MPWHRNAHVGVRVVLTGWPRPARSCGGLGSEGDPSLRSGPWGWLGHRRSRSRQPVALAATGWGLRSVVRHQPGLAAGLTPKETGVWKSSVSSRVRAQPQPSRWWLGGGFPLERAVHDGGGCRSSPLRRCKPRAWVWHAGLDQPSCRARARVHPRCRTGGQAPVGAAPWGARAACSRAVPYCAMPCRARQPRGRS